jgi:hypothetical protein
MRAKYITPPTPTLSMKIAKKPDEIEDGEQNQHAEVLVEK